MRPQLQVLESKGLGADFHNDDGLGKAGATNDFSGKMSLFSQ